MVKISGAKIGANIRCQMVPLVVPKYKLKRVLAPLLKPSGTSFNISESGLTPANTWLNNFGTKMSMSERERGEI
jgi:hypothetical protein